MATVVPVGEAVGAILDAMELRQDEITATVASTLLSQVDGYQLVRSDMLAGEFRDQCKAHIRLFLKMARTSKPPRPDDLQFIRQVGIRRADELSPLEAVLHGYRVGLRLMWEWIVREAGTSPEGVHAALSLTARTFDYMEVASGVVTAAYLGRSHR